MKLRSLFSALFLGTALVLQAAFNPLNDYESIGATGQTAVGVNIGLKPAGTVALDATDYHAVSVELRPVGTVSSGVVSFEMSADNVHFTTVPMTDTDSPATAAVTAVSPTSGVIRHFAGNLQFRYFRARISTTIGGGGWVEATVKFASTPFPIAGSGGGGGGSADSTAALQTAGNASLTSIDSKVPALSGGKVPVTDPTALPLPSGAATSANQTTSNSSLSSIDGKTPALGQATMSGSRPVAIASDQGPVSVTPTSSATALALGVKGTFTAYGNTRVTAEPSDLFDDPFDSGSIDTTNRWNAPVLVSGMTVTQSTGSQVVTTNTTSSASAFIDTQATFYSQGTAFLAFGTAVALEAQSSNLFALNQERFWGFGDRPTSYATATPLKNAVGFEVGTDGQLRCVVYENGTARFSASTNLLGANLNTLVSPSTGYVRYGIAFRADTIVFYIGQLEYPAQAFTVSSASFAAPDTVVLPVRFAAVNAPSGTVGASVFKYTAVGVSDTGRNSAGLSDGVYPWRKATVKPASTAAGATDSALVVTVSPNLSVGTTESRLPSAFGQGAAASAVLVTRSNENEQDLFFTGQSAQTATVNNIIPATSGATATDVTGFQSGSVQVTSTGTGGTFIFEGSNDNTNFQTVPVYNQLILTGTPITAAVTASATQIIYTFPIQFRYFRLRIASTITGGSIQAFSTFKRAAFSNAVTTIGNATAANLNATIVANTAMNVAQINAVTPLMGNGVTGTGSPRVTIASDTTANSNPFLVAGKDAISAATTGNPLIAGARVTTTLDTSLVQGDAAALNATDAGQLITKPYGSAGNDWSFASATSGILNTTTAVTVKSAAAASIRNYVTSIQIQSEALGTATEFAIRDGAAGTVLWRFKIGTSGCPLTQITFPTPLRGTAATLLEVVTLTASTTGAVYVNLQGYTSF